MTAICWRLLRFMLRARNHGRRRLCEAVGVNCAHHVRARVADRPVTYFVIPTIGTRLHDVRDAGGGVSTGRPRATPTFTFSLGGQSHAGTDGTTERYRPLRPSRQQREDTFAQSTLTYDSHTGEIFDVDIELNADEPFAILRPGSEPVRFRVDVRRLHARSRAFLASRREPLRSAVVMSSATRAQHTHRRSPRRSQRRADGLPARRRLTTGERRGGGNSGGGAAGAGSIRARRRSRMAVAAVLALLALRKGVRQLFREVAKRKLSDPFPD